MIWRCIDRTNPREEPWYSLNHVWEEALSGRPHPDGTGHGQGGEYLIGFDSGGDGCGMGFEHGTLKGANLDWADR